MYQSVLHNKFNDMIEIFRTELANLSPEVGRFCIDWFGKPCQIYFFSCEEYDLHLLIKTNFPDVEDKIIEIIEITPDNFENVLDEFANRAVWEKEMEGEENNFYFVPKSKRIDHILNVLVPFGEKIRQRRLDTQSRSNWFSGDRTFGYWDFEGNIEGVDLNEKVRSIVQSAQQSYQTYNKTKVEETAPSPIQYPKPSSCGAYFYPFLFVGEFKKTFKGQLSGSDFLHLDDIVYDSKFDDVSLVITKAGLIVLETDDAVKANKIINTIFGTALLLGLPAYANRLYEVAFAYIRDRAHVNSWQTLSIRTMMYDYRTRFLHRYDPRTGISLDILKEIVAIAENVWKGDFSTEVRLFLESFTYLNNSEFLQSFNASWLIIERYLGYLLDKTPESKIPNNKRPEKWESHKILPLLKSHNVIEDKEYSYISGLKFIRNHVFHGNREPDQDEVKKCQEMASMIVRKVTGINEKFDSTKFELINM